MEIREIIQKIVKETIERSFGIPATVVAGSYDPVAQTVDVEPVDGSADFLSVRLMSEVGDGVLMIPEDNSVVIIEETSQGSAYVSLFGKIKSIKFRDGSSGGLVDVNDLVIKLNILESRMGSHQHTVLAFGISTPDPVSNPVIPPTTAPEISNPDITHG